MTMTLREVGFWWNPDDVNQEYPRVQTMVDPRWDARERAAVLDYVRRGRTHLQSRGWSDCRVCGARNGSADLTDGTYVWPEGFAHYIERHAVRPPADFVRHVVASRALGQVEPAAQRGSPPSTYAILSLLEGRPGALGDVAVNTAMRMLLIAPGLWLAGVRGEQLLKYTAAASVSVTVGLTGYYAWKRSGSGE